MRVLLVTAEYPPANGGIGDYTALLADHLAQMDATVTVVTSGDGGEIRNGAVTVLPVVPRWGWRMIGAMYTLIRRTEPDVVHVQYQAGMYGMHPAINLLPRLWHRTPAPPGRSGEPPERSPSFVTTFHDLREPYLFPKAGPLRGAVMRQLARGSDAVIATNGADLATLRAWGANVSLVPIGSNIPVANAVDVYGVRGRYRIPATAVLLTTFGLLNHSKGLTTLVDAVAMLRRDGMDAYLLAVGAGAGTSDVTNVRTVGEITARARDAGITPYLIRTGALLPCEVAQALAACDVCLLPYRDGASPRRGSLLAALAQDIPVVTTTPAPHAYDGLPPLRDRDAAIFVPPDDVETLAAAVRAIVANPDLAMRLRAGAAAYARLYDWPEIAQRTIAAYESVCTIARDEADIGAAPPGNH